jgi:SAM-dependent methyltransferase
MSPPEDQTPHRPKTPAKRWYDDYFGAHYIATYRDRLSEQRTQHEVDLIARALGLSPGMRVLDTACGHGRHAIELAARGFDVVGVDINPYAIELATKIAAERGLADKVRFVRADLRDLTFVESFDGAFNYFTSFGWLESESEDERALHAITCALKNGATFMLETMNLYHVAAVFRPTDEWEVYSTGYSMKAEREWDVIQGRMHEWRTIRDPQGVEHRYDAHLRIYSPTELSAMFWRVGLNVEQALEAPSRKPCTLGSMRLALVGRRGHGA